MYNVYISDNNVHFWKLKNGQPWYFMVNKPTQYSLVFYEELTYFSRMYMNINVHMYFIHPKLSNN